MVDNSLLIHAKHSFRDQLGSSYTIIICGWFSHTLLFTGECTQREIPRLLPCVELLGQYQGNYHESTKTTNPRMQYDSVVSTN